MSETEDWSYHPDFVERNGAWLLSLIGIVATCFTALLAYFLKSRCVSIRCWGVECVRDVLDLEHVHESADQLEIRRRNSPGVLINTLRNHRPRPPSSNV